MTETAKLYGFGSFFRETGSKAKDVDILVLHRTAEHSSIGFAIKCKAMLRARIAKADVVMLAEEEEQEIGFLDRSKAIFLCHLTSDDIDRASKTSSHLALGYGRSIA